MIYFMPICEADQMEEQYQVWLPHLPPVRREKLLRYRFVKDRWLCATAYMLLLHTLQHEYGINENQVRMEVEKNGKPYLASHPYIFFNLSHCDSGVVCGISSNPIGVDIEVIRDIDSRVTKRVCNTAEQNILAHAGNPAYTFTSMWTLKESYLKAIGCGLSSCSLTNISVSMSTDRDLYISQNGYDAYVLDHQCPCCISICEKTEAPIQNLLHKVKPEMFA